MLIKIVNGSVSYGNETILEQVDFQIDEKEKVAIVGRNGCGKTTFLKTLLHPESFSEGLGEDIFSFYKNSSISIGYLEQQSLRNENITLKEELLSVFEPLINIEKKLKLLEENMTDYILYEKLLCEYKNFGGYEYLGEIDKMISKFGFKQREQNQIKEFSGGERTKIALMKLLLQKPKLLLLDEPTNHLDLDTIIWLEEYLKNYPYSLLLISHDRMFIDHIVNKVYEIEYGVMTKYVGNYSSYERQKKENYEKQLKDYHYQQKEIKRLQDIADRFRYKPSKASMAMSKLKKIEQMVLIDKPLKQDTRSMKLSFPVPLESGDIVLTVKNLEIGYDKVLQCLSFILHKNERLAVLGKNGCGKSTLLQTLVGFVPKLRGSFSFGYHVTYAYFDQQMHNLLDSHTVLEEMQEVMSDKSTEEIRRILGRFLFTNEDYLKKVANLSGGEKVRLSFAKLFFEAPNFLILDEPTNHMDLLSKEVLEKCLTEYKGTVLFVSHDRYFIEKVADSILYLDDEVEYFRGSYTSFMEQRKNIFKNDFSLVSKKKEKIVISSKEQEKRQKKLEKEISLLEKEYKEIEEAMFLEENYLDYQKMRELEDRKEDILKLLEEKLYLLENVE